MKLKKGDYPVSEKTTARVVSIPVFPDMLKGEQEEVIEIVRSVSA
jgi:dTDP-4-amino-4,6-dideoxygalactose transaminase